MTVRVCRQSTGRFAQRKNSTPGVQRIDALMNATRVKIEEVQRLAEVVALPAGCGRYCHGLTHLSQG